MGNETFMTGAGWVLFAGLLAACGSDETRGQGGPESCEADTLRTGLPSPENVDSFDCTVLHFADKYEEPDAMIFKAIIRIESHFKIEAIGCAAPCGIPEGWSAEEARCLGLMQIVAACNPKSGDLGLLPNGHPNMTLDTSSPLWATSIFHPTINIERGIRIISNNRARMRTSFPGCTEDQYTLMAMGEYNRYGSAQSCNEWNSDFADLVLPFYAEYSTSANWPARSYADAR